VALGALVAVAAVVLAALAVVKAWKKGWLFA
jgi:hypothetical protein